MFQWCDFMLDPCWWHDVLKLILMIFWSWWWRCFNSSGSVWWLLLFTRSVTEIDTVSLTSYNLSEKSKMQHNEAKKQIFLWARRRFHVLGFFWVIKLFKLRGKLLSTFHSCLLFISLWLVLTSCYCMSAPWKQNLSHVSVECFHCGFLSLSYDFLMNFLTLVSLYKHNSYMIPVLLLVSEQIIEVEQIIIIRLFHELQW